MKISHKLLVKYAVGTAMLPPPHEEVVEEVVIPRAKVPQIQDLSEQEMKDWERFIAEKKLLKDLGITKEMANLGGESKAGGEVGTVPAVPRKKADISPDALLKRCTRFHDLCRKF